jgi:hypothetical protein
VIVFAGVSSCSRTDSGSRTNSSRVTARTIPRPSIRWWYCVQASEKVSPVRAISTPAPNDSASEVRMALALNPAPAATRPPRDRP